MKIHPVTCMANACRRKWARAEKSFKRNKITKEEFEKRMNRTWAFPMKPLWGQD